jgi:hypothetical protein
MDLTRKQIGTLIKLGEKHVVIDRVVYDPGRPERSQGIKTPGPG